MLSQGTGLALVVRGVEAAVLLVIAVIDLRHRLVYGALSYPAIVGALAVAPLVPGTGLASAVGGLAVGAALFGAFYLGGRLVYRSTEPMGLGDVTIASLIGAMTGFPKVIGALFLGSLAVGAFALVALATHRVERKSFLPYGPGLCLGGVVAIFL